MFRHYYKTDNAEPISIPHLLEDIEEQITTDGSRQQGLPNIATPGDEVQCSSVVIPP
jgi:hypothetical protein